MAAQEHAWETGRVVWHGLYGALILLVALLATAVARPRVKSRHGDPDQR